MSKNKAKNKEQIKKDIQKDNERFHAFCLKIKERLTIIFDHNVANKIDLIEEDVLMLKEMKEWYDKSASKWAEEASIMSGHIIQTQIPGADTSDNK